MSFNENWPRWCFASFSKFFDDRRQNLTMYVDGSDRATTGLQDFIEFRMDGPRIKQIGRSLVKLEVTVNILVQSQMNDSDIHAMQRTMGIVIAAFEQIVPGFKYGDGVDDDQSQFACFVRESPSGQKIGFDVRINNFGIIDPTVRKQQATIEASYSAEIEV